MKRRFRRSSAAVLTAMAVVAMSACSASGGSASSSSGDVDQATVDKADKALADLEGKVLSTGPHGEEASSPDEVDLTDDQVNQVKAMGATAAIVMHYGGNDWSTAQIDGLKSEFGRLGINVIATTDANFKPEQQVSDLETDR